MTPSLPDLIARVEAATGYTCDTCGRLVPRIEDNVVWDCLGGFDCQPIDTPAALLRALECRG